MSAVTTTSATGAPAHTAWVGVAAAVAGSAFAYYGAYEGLNNVRIAARLQISDKTVRNHVSNVLTKLAVSDRAKAIVRAREAGLGREARSRD